MTQDDLDDRVLLLKQCLAQLDQPAQESILEAMIGALEAVDEPEPEWDPERPRKPDADPVPVPPIRDILNRLRLLRSSGKRL